MPILEEKIYAHGNDWEKIKTSLMNSIAPKL
jgi:hypothetical protein